MMASGKKATGPKRKRKESTGGLPVDDAIWREHVGQLGGLSERWLNEYRRLSKGEDRAPPETAAKVTRILTATFQALILNESSRLDGLAKASGKLLDRFTRDLRARNEQLMFDASPYAPPGREKWFVPITDPIRGQKYERGLSGRNHSARAVVNALAWLLEPNTFPWLDAKNPRLPWDTDLKAATVELVQTFLTNLTVGTTWTEFLLEHDIRLGLGDLDAGTERHRHVATAFERRIGAAGKVNPQSFRTPQLLAEELFVDGLIALGVPPESARGLLAAENRRAKRAALK